MHPAIYPGRTVQALFPKEDGKGTHTHLSPFAAGGKLCLTAATNSATVSSKVKITALGPASNVYATWNPQHPQLNLPSAREPQSPRAKEAP